MLPYNYSELVKMSLGKPFPSDRCSIRIIDLFVSLSTLIMCIVGEPVINQIMSLSV